MFTNQAIEKKRRLGDTSAFVNDDYLGYDGQLGPPQYFEVPGSISPNGDAITNTVFVKDPPVFLGPPVFDVVPVAPPKDPGTIYTTGVAWPTATNQVPVPVNVQPVTGQQNATPAPVQQRIFRRVQVPAAYVQPAATADTGQDWLSKNMRLIGFGVVGVVLFSLLRKK